MAFTVQKCGIEDCPQVLYVLAEPGEQRIYCGKCGAVTLFKLRTDADDSDSSDDEADETDF